MKNKTEKYLLPIKKDIRKKVDLQDGEVVEVSINII